MFPGSACPASGVRRGPRRRSRSNPRSASRCAWSCRSRWVRAKRSRPNASGLRRRNSDADGIPQLLFGRINVERSPSGTALVITNARPVNDPIVRLTVQAGCEAAMRREYHVVHGSAGDRGPRRGRGSRAARGRRRAAAGAGRTRIQAPGAARGARLHARGIGRRRAATAPGPARKPAPAEGARSGEGRAETPAGRGCREPRLSLSSGAPGTVTGRGATAADRERAQQEQAAAIEAETQVLQQRIVELTALVERMQQEVRAQEIAEQEAAAAAAKAASQGPAAGAPAEPAKAASADAAKAPPPAPAADWWDDNAALIAAIVLVPLLIAAALLWKRRRGAADEDQWRTGRSPATPAAERGAGAARLGIAQPDRRTRDSPCRNRRRRVTGKESDRESAGRRPRSMRSPSRSCRT